MNRANFKFYDFLDFRNPVRICSLHSREIYTVIGEQFKDIYLLISKHLLDSF